MLQEMLSAQGRLIEGLRKPCRPIECQQSQRRSRRSGYQIESAVQRNPLGIEHFGKTPGMVEPFLFFQKLARTDERINDGGLTSPGADARLEEDADLVGPHRLPDNRCQGGAGQGGQIGFAHQLLHRRQE
jgi:hypothetical protein